MNVGGTWEFQMSWENPVVFSSPSPPSIRLGKTLRKHDKYYSVGCIIRSTPNATTCVAGLSKNGLLFRGARSDSQNRQSFSTLSNGKLQDLLRSVWLPSYALTVLFLFFFLLVTGAEEREDVLLFMVMNGIMKIRIRL